MKESKSSGTLYIVATPIGNLRDITLRAIDTLKEADLIACEDTRQTRKLTSHYGIAAPLTSFFAHNERQKLTGIVRALKEGKRVALVSDAGTPGISDPGYLLIREALEEGINVESIPGPSAVIAGAVISGMPLDRFLFEGFLSAKGAQRRKRLTELSALKKTTIVLYESPHRLLKCLGDIGEIFGNIDIVAVRELTKLYEETLRMPAQEMAGYFTRHRPRGEFLLLFRTKK
ncbi:MAG: 16S rRNA (cytidine(1402)-2'-O)-methyltransferase [Candidatus Omnitrophica bacterium]|nr:16S rRNA (cytidine(1402)-2'-O)-methyltransferase [Candidatus Omnitrophota bacterium]